MSIFAAFDRATVRAGGLSLRTGHGLFSADRLDEGTALLLEHLPELGGRVLEVGCGYGALALPVAARGASVLAVDRDLVAVRYTARNAEANGVALEARASLGYDAVPERGFDLVLSNVPARIGAAGLAHFVDGGLGRLAPGGEVRIVVIRDLTPTIEALARERSLPCARVARGPRHDVLSLRGIGAEPEGLEAIYARDEIVCGGLSFVRPHDVSEDPGHATDGAPLLAELLPKRPSDALVWRSAHGVMAVLLAKRGARVVCADRDLLALAFAGVNAARHAVRVQTAPAAWLPELDARAPLVVAELSSAAGVRVAEAELAAVRARLAPGGVALVSAPEKLATALGMQRFASRGAWCVSRLTPA